MRRINKKTPKLINETEGFDASIKKIQGEKDIPIFEIELTPNGKDPDFPKEEAPTKIQIENVVSNGPAFINKKVLLPEDAKILDGLTLKKGFDKLSKKPTIELSTTFKHVYNKDPKVSGKQVYTAPVKKSDFTPV